MRVLNTIGYELTSIGDFITALQGAGVGCVIDVRAVPVSRKAGFSKKALSRFLADSGIGYQHIPGLGNPKPGRDAARAGQLADFKKIYRAHLKTADAQRGFELAADVAATVNACLLCYERDPEICHRSLVAKKLSLERGFSIENLVVQEGLSTVLPDGSRKSPYPGESPAATEQAVW